MTQILTDVDGVLLDWIDGFLNWCVNHKSYPTTILDQRTNAYDLETMLSTTLDVILSLITEFNNSPYFGQLRSTKHSEIVIPKLLERGYTFIAITACGEDHHHYETRLNNLVQVFGSNVFDELVILPVGGCKKDALLKYKDTNMVWIEDTVSHCVAGADLGLNAHLINQVYNTDNISDLKVLASGITRVNDWHELAEKL